MRSRGDRVGGDAMAAVPAPGHETRTVLAAGGTLAITAMPVDQAAPGDDEAGKDGKDGGRVAHPGQERERHAGARAAVAALEALGFPAPVVRRGPRGAPLGPPGSKLSIAHTQRYAVAAAWAMSGTPDEAGTEVGRVVALGVDIEAWHGLQPSARHLVSRPDEREAFAAVRGWSDVTKLFTVKEALFKAGCGSGERLVPRRIEVRPRGSRLAVTSGHGARRATVAVTRMDGHWVALCLALAA